ncbi:MAG: HAMP domain-containing histidine kinase [Clostridia bacterium]|nr:HAMP domain-containing histidine kinase [Clostridia bacterium]
MRKWNLTLAARIVAGVLFMIFAMGTFLGAGACVALFQYNAFNDDGAELFDAAAEYLMDHDTNLVRSMLGSYYYDPLSVTVDNTQGEAGAPQRAVITLPYNLYTTHTNFRFTAENEDVILSNGIPSENCFGYREEPWVIYTYGEVQHQIQEYPTQKEADWAADRLRDENRNDYTNIYIQETSTGWQMDAYYRVKDQHTVTARYGIDANLPVLDRYAVGLTLVNALIACRNWAIPLTALCLVLAVAAFIFLLVSAGHRTGTAEVSRNWFDKVPLELVLLGMAAVVGFSMEVLTDRFLVVFGLFLPMLLALGLLFCMTFAVRCKTKTLVKGTILYWVLRWAWAGVKWLWYVLVNLPLIWKTILIWGGISLVELVMVAGYARGPLAVFWFLEKLILTPELFAFVIGLKKLQDGAKRMAAGDMGPVSERYMFPSERQHAQSLNSIGRGAVLAAEQRLKSERMKTELITNVSHDLKTPLTSIISYVDLLKKEGLSSEHAPEYVDVLDRQSQRLKKLTEDLVEASKASTGNIQAQPEDVDVNLLLSQAAGEYAERLAAAGLKTVTTWDPSEPHIRADGRLLWRVFDNLLSNVTKYAQPGTRVYLSTAARDGGVEITFRNVSRDELNVSAEELMERFVRGDASRNSEGSGLGLSIAKSLTELNNGTLSLTVDGDLFKATLAFLRNE